MKIAIAFLEPKPVKVGIRKTPIYFKYLEERLCEKYVVRKSADTGRLSRTDDGAYEATFDAIPWLRQAELDEIVTLEGAGFRGDYSADDVAWWAADPQGGNDPDVAHVLHRVQKDSLPFEVWVDGEQATAWLDAERPGWSEWSDEGEV